MEGLHRNVPDFSRSNARHNASPDLCRNLFTAFLTKGPEHYLLRMKEILEEDESSTHFAFEVNVQDVIHFDPTIGHMLLQQPEYLLQIFEEAYQSVQMTMAGYLDAQIPRKGVPTSEYSNACSRGAFFPGGFRPAIQGSERTRVVKDHVHLRLCQLPPSPEFYKPSIASIRTSDVGHLVQVSGTVVRIGTVKMLSASRSYICRRCDMSFKSKADIEQNYLLQIPRACPGCAAPNPEEMSSRKVDQTDLQEIKIQEQMQNLKFGSIPRSLTVALEHDLVDYVRPGDDVVITGSLVRRWRSASPERRPDVEVILRANSIRLANKTQFFKGYAAREECWQEFERFWQNALQHPIAARNVILRSVCPQVYGMLIVKLSILLTIIGGVEKVVRHQRQQVDPGHSKHSSSAAFGSVLSNREQGEEGMRVRYQPHLLLVGDPGTGKSQFLRFATRLVPRSVLTTGIGTTNAGLTCSAVKDGTEWVLEAGALVLADRGLCCIDEFSSIREHDRTAIHEAMEQQTLSVAKAGLVCKLNARSSVIAVTNPKGQLADAIEEDVTTNTAINAPLLSRFDVILLLTDRTVADWNAAVADFVLDGVIHEDGNEREPDRKTATPPRTKGHLAEEGQVWSVNRLQKYIAYVKDRFQPELIPESQMVLERYYQLQRRSDGRNMALTTIRLLESLIRLSEAHARLMSRDQVTMQDAVVAILCVEASRRSIASLAPYRDLSFEPEDPDQAYADAEAVLLQALAPQQ